MANIAELQYLNLLGGIYEKIIFEGFDDARDGHKRARIFGAQMRFNLQKGFPLLTHKKVFLRGIFEELMWFLRGETDNKILREKNVNIWNEWENALVPFGYPEGELGAIYGESWRNFGEVKSQEYDHNGHLVGEIINQEGFDQIKWVIEEIKRNPHSSRLIVNAWNPHVHCVSGKAALPPCHTMFQFFVSGGKLSCQLYQRSADLLLGVPFNIASYALLTHIVAIECGLEVGDFVWTGGDIHVYENQLQAVPIVLSRPTYAFPTIEINSDWNIDGAACKKSFDEYVWEDITLHNYQSGDKIEIEVST